MFVTGSWEMGWGMFLIFNHRRDFDTIECQSNFGENGNNILKDIALKNIYLFMGCGPNALIIIKL